MKRFLLLIVVSALSLSVFSQQSLFDYNRGAVGRMMVTGNPTGFRPVYAGYSLMSTTDPAMNYKQSFWAGAIGGFAGPLAGLAIGGFGAEVLKFKESFGWASTLVGVGLGFLVPQIIVYRQTGDPKACGKAALGSLAGLGVDLVLLAALIIIGESQ